MGFTVSRGELHERALPRLGGSGRVVTLEDLLVSDICDLTLGCTPTSPQPQTLARWWLARLSYQISFKPNCTCREVVEVLAIAPAVPEIPEGVNTIRFGVLKFARFRRLKISARNCKLNRS